MSDPTTPVPPAPVLYAVVSVRVTGTTAMAAQPFPERVLLRSRVQAALFPSGTVVKLPDEPFPGVEAAVLWPDGSQTPFSPVMFGVQSQQMRMYDVGAGVVPTLTVPPGDAAYVYRGVAALLDPDTVYGFNSDADRLQTYTETVGG